MAPVKQLLLPLENPEGESAMGNLTEPKSTFCSLLIDRVLERNNLVRALNQVCRNKGAPGIDGMTVDGLPDYLKQHWPRIRQLVIDGRKRKLGIPTVLDRFPQQAIAQVLQTEWDTDFHDNSFGFRPNRSAHQAMRYAQETIREHYGWVVDCDLEAFFDGVNHDVLMGRLKAKHQDPELAER